MKYTDDQLKIINTRGKSILVSAAAGSGKTTVLVERIISMITDEENPVDIDSILVVTFTKAAAASMKEKIYRAVKEKLREKPDNKNLHRQLGLVGVAHISTIDSFCSDLVRNHFNEVGIDPGFVVGDETTISLLKAESLDEVLESAFAKGESGFIKLADGVINKNQNTLKEMILTIYDQAQSHPWPDDYIESLKAPYMVENVEELEQMEWYAKTLQHIKSSFDVLYMEYNKLKERSDSELPGKDNEPHPYTICLADDLNGLEKVAEQQNICEGLKNFRFVTLSSKKVDGEDADTRESIKKQRGVLKKQIEELKKICPDNVEILNMIKTQRPILFALLDITREFIHRFDAEKRKYNYMDFSDLEHYALKILIDEKTKEETEAARLIKKQYSTVMVDEYQDSNELQEVLLSAISAESEGRYNYFMVGDVKQSIYRFRKAKPAIFLGKQNTYGKYGNENDSYELINLSNNFRSRKAVVDSVNAVFETIMRADMGGIEYDENARLVCSAPYLEDKEYNQTECCLIISDDDEAKSRGLDATQLEAMLIVEKIRQITDSVKVTNPDGSLRAARLSDIVILHRSANAITSSFEKVFSSMNMPLRVAGASGYFDSFEIESLTAMLSILNNPLDDIPLCTVLKNIYGYTDRQLAEIRMDDATKGMDFNRAVFNLSIFNHFIEDYKWLRENIEGKRIYEILNLIIEKTNFKKIIYSMSTPKLRMANINKLGQMAIAFENGNRFLLYDFISHVTDLKKYDLNKAIENADDGDAVTLMTIHKSKGLEFPICILAGAGKELRGSKSQGGMLLSDIGIGMDYADRSKNISVKSKIKAAIERFEKEENAAENLRLLYVALTRAEEKLVICGSIRKKDYDVLMNMDKESLNYIERLNSKSFFTLTIPMLREKNVSVKTYDLAQLAPMEVENIVKKKLSVDQIKNLIQTADSNETDRIRQVMDFSYPVLAAGKLKSKYSVSELKSMHLEMDQEPELLIDIGTDEGKKPYPGFMSDETDEKNMAAIRGTAVHRFMEYVDFSKPFDYDKTKDNLVKKGILSEEEASLVRKEWMDNFFNSSLSKRMAEASKSGNLIREKTFVMAVPRSMLIKDKMYYPDGDEDVLIQGVIDAFFIENGKIALLDYKTDKVNNEKELIEKYKDQLDYYGMALKGAYSQEVFEKLIYSFYLNMEIIL